MTPSELALLLDTRTLPAIVVHGGAGMRPGQDLPPVREGIARATAAGFAVLLRGGSALEAVETAVLVLEDDPEFNAGRGSCLTADGTVEMDASIMRGDTLDAGAVAGVAGVRNPVRLARRVMEESDHLLLVGPGAERFAREISEPMVEPDWHVVPAQRTRWEELKLQSGPRPDRTKLGTVGACAVDLHGHVAAATSTGGTAFKRPGRVGDSPLIGAGTWAEDETAAISATGHGESIIRTNLARWTAERVGQGLSPQDAAVAASTFLKERVNGDGGLIVAARDGRLGWSTNTPRMSRGMQRAGMSEPFAGF